jgi:class 3 adenylate cyclase
MLRRLRPLDKVVLAIWLPIWLAAFGLALSQVVQGRVGYHLGRVSPGPDREAYPVLQLARGEVEVGEPRPRAGDRLLRVGGADLRGVGRLGFDALAFENTGPDRRTTLVFERDGQRRETWIELAPPPFGEWDQLSVSLVMATTGLLLLLRAGDSRAARAFAVAFLVLCFGYIPRFGVGPAEQHYAWVAMRIVTEAFWPPLSLTALLLFPEDSARRSRCVPVWPWFFAANGIFAASRWSGWIFSTEVDALSDSIVAIALPGLMLVVITHNYRHAMPIGRRRIRWVVYGFYLALLPIAVSSGLAVLYPDLWRLQWLGRSAAVFIPLSILISVLRFNLFDIDRLISATASYSILGTVVLLVLHAGVPAIARAGNVGLGIDPTVTQIALAVALAAVAVAAHRALRPRLDRLFFPERRYLEEALHHLLEDLSAQSDPRNLTMLVGEQLSAQFRPESCVMYASPGSGYEPVFTRGRAVPPAIDARSPLITHLDARSSPLASDRFSKRDRIEQLDTADRAALDTLGAAVVVPVRRQGQLVAFLCLGPKRSGDIYTSTDLALLTAVANTVSTQLERMDQEEITREARAMQQELRRYVPGAIASELEAGADLEPRERPVSVLFVDIRGYTAYTESRQAHEVFTTINRYTQTVSAIVEKFGGSVVEFNGDGMMAVFGAPTPLPDKERAAVSAGREIVTKVQGLGGTDESGTISVGVGVATGSAFVGSIQAVDRMIWTALGNTTNLAARLQGLTRELDAAMVIDLATWRAAGEPPEFQRREQVAIRGRSQREDLYVLSLGKGGET